METRENDELEIDLFELFFVLLDRIWLLVICAAVVGAIAFSVSKFILPEKFQSTTTVYVLSRQSNNTNALTYSDLQTGSQLTKDYQQMIKSRYVLESVIENLGLKTTYEKLLKKVSVNTPTDTRMISITVTDHIPAKAQQIANEIRKVASVHIKNVMAIEAVNVVDEANFPMKKSEPSVTKWTLIGIILGGFAAAAFVIIRHLMDDTIKSADDIKNYLNLSTLALIPISEPPQSASENTNSHHHRNSSGSNNGNVKKKIGGRV